MMHRVRLPLYAIPFLIWSGDASAWGLHTHVYFAQLLVWAIPLLDPKLRRAVLKYPRLVMAGACLPDLALSAPRVGSQAFAQSHTWRTIHELLAKAECETDQALAVGYASHLLVDVIAHNHFVPAHEKLWLDVPWLTHVTVEWAMDAHIARHAFAQPGELLAEEEAAAADFAARFFGCSGEVALKSLRLLAKADRQLRRSRIPELCYKAMRLDERLKARFDSYIEATSGRLAQLNRVLGWEAPAWEAELLCQDTKKARLAPFSRDQLRGLLPMPQDLFCQDSAEQFKLAA